MYFMFTELTCSVMLIGRIFLRCLSRYEVRMTFVLFRTRGILEKVGFSVNFISQGTHILMGNFHVCRKG